MLSKKVDDEIVIFISDIHLAKDFQTQENSNFHDLNKLFEAFVELVINHPNKDKISCYILGDLFNNYSGDDIELDRFAKSIELIKKLRQNTTETKILVGNRDFLVGKNFYQTTGAEELSRIKLENIFGADFLLMHGDELCTKDTKYQILKLIVNNSCVQSVYFCLPKSFRASLTANFQRKSEQHKSEKSTKDNIQRHSLKKLAPQEKTIRKYLNKFKADYLIHGHVHKSSGYKFDDTAVFVLSDWSFNEEINLNLKQKLKDFFKVADDNEFLENHLEHLAHNKENTLLIVSSRGLNFI